ncbi:hypothetical protein CRV01_02290 [Arcobacter sp. CECT 8983]|uniref:hypothetical protein n=1 Tax=Arcobacter sp. CECT 8983 TaxID=2044508 RepID=UPI00100A6E1E|nr:hypothetical protein [Arcobacter sp. CECT 8983]RXJ91127.1 hypothetical protein CRV01_02290 [Arcobacter sp. CECT 8983]
MTIYIYGSESFKNEINDILRHSNIKFRLDDKGEVKELKSLDQLKAAIEDNPNNIYLIDDSKIIKKNIFTDKINFFKPKDGIEQEYLLDHGIGDVSVDSIDELSKHIIRRLDSIVGKEDNIDDIQDSIIEIVEDAYHESNSDNTDEYLLDQVQEVNPDEETSKDDIEEVTLDDELSALLSSSKDEDSYFYDEEENESEMSDEEALADILNQVEEVEIPKKEESDFDPASNLDDLLVQLEESHNEQIDEKPETDEEKSDSQDLQDVLDQIEESSIPLKEDKEATDPLINLSFDDNLDNININESSIDVKKDSNTQGENMSDEFSEFDTLSENDILAALNNVDNVTVTKDNEDTKNVQSDNSSNALDVNSANTDDIAKLITQLLNNKTLEITIKVKE